MSTHDAKIHGQAHFYCERTRSELVAERDEHKDAERLLCEAVETLEAERDAARAEVTQLQVEARTSRAVEQSLGRQVAERDAWAKRWKAAAQKLWRARH